MSFKIFIHDYERNDYIGTIYLRAIIDRSKREFNLKVSWPKDFWDTAWQEALPGFIRDAELDMVIN